MKLIPQEELDVICPFFTEDITLFVNENADMVAKPEGLIYALAQVLHNKLKTLELSESDKGSIVANLITGFVEFNKQELAIYRGNLKMIAERKTSTIQ